MNTSRIYVRTVLSLDSKGAVTTKNLGVTFNIHEAEAHRAKGVENEFDTFQIDSDWQEDAATTELVIAMRGFRDMVKEMQDAALR
jgi:hypothetical protein